MSINDDSLGPSVTPKLALDDKSLVKVLISAGVVFVVALLVSLATVVKVADTIRKQLRKENS